MRIACIGGGPAGLYLGTLLRAHDPSWQVVVHERNRADDTFGFGVVFSDATLGRLAAADPISHAEITARFARWDDIELHVAGEVLRSTGHGFCALRRAALLEILQRRALAAGVEVRIGDAVATLAEVGPADLIVIADGAASTHRDALAAALQPTIDVRPNKFVWLGTTLPLRAFTFLFVETRHGLLRVHAYPFAEHGPAAGGATSTFIVECTADTWTRAGLDGGDEDRTIAVLGELLARELEGHALVKNRSIWRSFPTVRCAHWHASTPAAPVVLIGDAAHTAHFSIGSGTKLAMEDAITLAEELARPAGGSVALALARYEARRRPEVEALQVAAEASLRWFEHTERYRRQPPAQFAYNLMTRSLRVSHASMARRDPELTAAVESLVAARAGELGSPPPRPSAVALALPGLKLASRLAVADAGGETVTADGVVGDDHLVRLGALAQREAALVLTEVMDPQDEAGGPGLFTDEQVVGWRRVVDYVHGRTSSAIAAVLRVSPDDRRGFVEATWRAEFARFDALVLALDALTSPEAVGAAVAASRKQWAERRPLIARLPALPPPQLLLAAERARQEGAAMVWLHEVMPVGAGLGVDAERILAADAVRHDAQVPVAVSLDDATPDDLDAVIAAGRADLVVLRRAPAELGWTSRRVRPR